MVAVLVFEFISSGEGGEYTIHALQAFGKIVIIGASIGFSSAYVLFYLIRQKLIPHYLLNVFTLALVLGVFVASDERRRSWTNHIPKFEMGRITPESLLIRGPIARKTKLSSGEKYKELDSM